MKVFIFGVLLLVSNFAIAKVTLTQNGLRTTYNVEVEGIEVRSSSFHRYTNLHLKGVQGHQGILYEVGKPQIPVVRFFVEGNGQIKIRALSMAKYRKSPSSKLVQPCQESIPKIPGAKANFSIDRSSYGKNAYYPKAAYRIDSVGSKRGTPLRLVTLYPISYNPVQNRIKTISRYSVQFTGKAAALEQKSANITFVVGSQFAKSRSLKKYINFKKGLGYSTSILVYGKDVSSPKEIRSALQRALQNKNINYAIIIGDHDDVPTAPGIRIPRTDHYYRAIDTKDYGQDIGAPDIGLGRISATSESQLKKILEKYMKYEKGNFKNKDWLKKAMFIATNDTSYYQVAEGTHDHVVATHTKKLGYTGQFPNDPQAGGDKLYAISHSAANADLMQSAKDGRTIINYSGHGTDTTWHGPHLDRNDVTQIKSEAMPFVVSNACDTGNFLYGEAFSEAWQRAVPGAIMFWGSIESTYWKEDDVLERRMYDGIFKDGNRKFSVITQFALQELWKYLGGAGRSKYYFETYESFGDPSIELRIQ